MSIQFLRAWNGYEQHAVVSTLSATEESRLVGLFLARYFTKGMDGQSDVPITATPEQAAAFSSPVSGDGKKVYRAGMAIVANPTSMSDYTVGGAPTVAEIVTRGGRRAIRMVTNGATTCDVQVALKQPRSVSRASVTCEFPVPEDWAGGGISLQFAVDGAYANRMVMTNSFGNDTLFPGVCNYAPQRIGTIAAPSRFLEWDGFGTVPDDATMHSTLFNYARVRFTPKAGAIGSEVFLYGAWVDEIDESPSLIITTDDCDASIYTYALEILERHGLRCTLGYMHDKVMSGGSSMTVAQCRDAFARGHEFNTHGCKAGINSLRDYNKNVALIEAELNYQRSGLISNGLARNGSENIYVYPQGYFRAAGDYNDTTIVQALKRLGFTAARIASFQGGRPEPISWSDSRYFIPIIGHNYNYSGNETNNLTDLIDRMTKTAEDGLSYPSMWHIVTTGVPDLSEKVQRSNFERFAEAAAYLRGAGKAVNRTFSEHVARCNAAFGL